MKYILILIATISMTAQAGTCDDLSSVSGAIMRARQDGASMSLIWSIKTNKTLNKYAHYEVKRAWSQPRYTTDEYQQKAIDDFTDEAFLECYQVMNK